MKAKTKNTRTKHKAHTTARGSKAGSSYQRNASTRRRSSTGRPSSRSKVRRNIKYSVELAVCYPKKLLVPHDDNQFRPHLIRWQGLAILCAVIMLLQGAHSYMSTGRISVLGTSTTTSVSGLLENTNEARQAAGVSGLRLNKKLDQAALNKAHDMIKYDYWAHVSPAGVQPWFWLDQQGYSYNKAGENLAKNYASSESTVNAWLASPTHRDNVLNKNYTDVGFAVVDGNLLGEDTSLVVAMYGQPSSGTVLASSANSSANRFAVGGPLDRASLGVVGSIGLRIKSLDTVTLGILSILLLTALVAAVTYRIQSSLPASSRAKHGHRRFGYKAAILVIVVTTILLSVKGGQI